MNNKSLSSVVFFTFTLLFLFSPTPFSNALGSGTTLAVVDTSATDCGIVSSQPSRRIVSYRNDNIISAVPEVSFTSISGGKNYFRGIRSGNNSILSWNTVSSNTTFEKRRLYYNDTVLYENLAVGDSRVCATVVGVGTVSCWRINKGFVFSSGYDQFSSITSGFGFSCGILKNSSSGSVRCFGNVNLNFNESIAKKIENKFLNISTVSLVAGESHVCGFNSIGFLVSKGSNNFGQVDVPNQEKPFEYSDSALGSDHSCAIRRSNGSVVCWSGKGLFNVDVTKIVYFEVIVSGSNFVFGLTTNNFSVICWGPGWFNNKDSIFELPLPPILLAVCVQSSCSQCGIYPQSQYLCSGFVNICKPQPRWPQMLPPEKQSWLPVSRSMMTLTESLSALIAIAGICTWVYCFWNDVCLGNNEVHNSVQPTITRVGSSHIITINSETIICQGQSSNIICGICFDSITYSNIFKTSSCNHPFCTDCMSKYINVQRDKNVVKPNCPDPECSVELKPQHFQSILPNKLIVEWESAIYESSISPTQESYCPYKNCSVLLFYDGPKDIKISECPSCERLFCAQCKVPWHVNMNCHEFQKSKKGLYEKRLDREFLELAKRERWQKCPKCFIYVQKTTGCEHIRCRCECDFCYRCGKVWNFGHICKS